MLAYQYLTEEHAEAAVRQLKIVTDPPAQGHPVGAVASAARAAAESGRRGRRDPARSRRRRDPSADGSTAPPGTEGKLEGNWTAQPNKDMKITVALPERRAFRLECRPARQGPQFAGNSSYENGILTFVQDQNNNTMVGNVHWTDESHFTFKVIGAGPTIPGLSFSKA